ncbi:MAG TPA: 1,2-phenylacetyl-CoA epoxidase subunit PaaD [Gemmatimonadaceae bacterium]|jgi:ring-1,2-phenylacetyl-CoA epoxidase subunit PaaD|nr:1,2-phenylacetyl-CoA epoxidase subunit PaaD [Gemmatimonadaceae bacterium]
MPSRDDLYRIVGEVKDPEVPVLSVVELGIVRDVQADGSHVTVTLTPTYSGCPAMRTIEQDIRDTLATHGITDVSVETVYSPAWTTDWIGPEAREKLRQFGIAPPGPAEQGGLITLTRRRTPVPCPFCGSSNTERRSEFGSTACKAIHFCNACRQPFDEFKPF